MSSLPDGVHLRPLLEGPEAVLPGLAGPAQEQQRPPVLLGIGQTSCQSTPTFELAWHVDIVENLVIIKKCKRNARVLFFLCSEARLVQKQPGKRQANLKKGKEIDDIFISSLFRGSYLWGSPLPGQRSRRPARCACQCTGCQPAGLPHQSGQRQNIY